MNSCKPPAPIPDRGKFLFLAGTIDMGRSEDWQERVERALFNTDWTVLNPRRDAWDGSWKQDKDSPQFREQVEWELDALTRAEKILMYLAPGSKSPVSLLELGLFAKSGKLIVVCPEGYWRKGNVDIVCERYGVVQLPDLESAVSVLTS